jgi:tetratricopeptide (TPR) repeat protein
MLGIAQTLIGQGQWDEAIEHCEGALLRFQQSGNAVGETDTIFALGLAHHGKGDQDEAAIKFEQAVTRYQQQHQPLEESDARYQRAGIMLENGQFDLAMDDLAQAIALVEQVMHTLSSPGQWSTFLHQYMELYTQAAITEVRLNQDNQAYTILSSFTRIAGRDAVKQQLKAYEDSIPTKDDELSEDEAYANKELIKRLGALRKSL